MNQPRYWNYLVILFAAVLLASLAGPGWTVRADDKETEEAKRRWREDTPAILRDLGIAMHNYHNDHNMLPPAAITSADGKPLLSWRVAILPYIEQEKLYAEFKLTEPWDSPHNKKLLEKMPAIFEPIGVKTKEKYVTYYQVFTGPGAPFEPGLKLSLGQWAVGDGTSNTFMIVEGAEPVPWTKPADLAFEADKALPKLEGPFKTGFHACFGDCVVRFVKAGIPARLVRQLMGWNDGGNEDVSGYLEP